MTRLFMAFSSASLGDWAKAGGGDSAIAKRTGSRNNLNARRRMAASIRFVEDNMNKVEPDG